MITADQIRAGRTLLRWSSRALAEKSGVSQPTIQRMEAADGVPHSFAQTLDSIKQTLEAAGIEFIPENGGGVGVRYKEPR